MESLTQQDRDELDALVADCEKSAQREGWTGPWTLQVGDLDSIILARRGTLYDAKLTAAEGEYLGISRAFGAHVDWTD